MHTKIIYFIIFIGSSLMGQTTIYPLGTPTDQIVEGGYEKDTQNQLNQFEGTWVYNQGSKKVTIKLQKLIDQNVLPNKTYYNDAIKGLYKVQNGQSVVYNDLNEQMLNGDISGIIFSNGYYKMTYWDEKECRLPYGVKIKLDPTNSNKLIWEMTPPEVIVAFDFEDECTRKLDSDWGSVVTIPLNMVLTKQGLSGGL